MSLVTQQNFFVYEYNVLNEEMHISNYLSTSLYVYLSLYIYNIYIYAHIHTYINQKQLYVGTQSFMLNAIIQPTK